MTAPLVHHYAPRGAAVRLFNSREKKVLIAGPAGTGKSLACLEKLNMLMLANPGARGLIVRKTHSSLGSTALDTWRKFVVKEALMTGAVHFYGGSAEEPPQYRYSNGSAVLLGGLDTVADKPPKIMSSEYDVIYVQEATELTEADWEALTTRLRNWRISFQQLIADCNPAAPTHWLKAASDAGRILMLHSRHEDNPKLYDEATAADGSVSYVVTEQGKEYMALLDALTGVRRLRLRLGIWAAADGMVYENFDEGHHIVDRFDIPHSWDRYWSVDFGHTNPFVLQCWAMDPDGRLFMYREIYHTKRLVEDHARQILSIVAPDGEWIEPEPIAIVCDHDAEGRATLDRHLGRGTVAADKRVGVGLEAVEVRLRKAGDGRARLFLLRDSVVERDPELLTAKKPASTAEEFPGYVWRRGPDGKPVPEEPNKDGDHGMDAKRYLVMHCDGRRAGSVRWL